MKMRLCLTLAVVTFMFMLMNPCTNLRVHFSLETPINGGIEEARARLQEAYNATAEAEGIGTEVSEAVNKLNNALDYILQAESLAAQGEIEQATLLTKASIRLSEEILVLIQELKQQAETLSNTRLIVYAAMSVALLTFSVYALFIGRRMWKKRQQRKFMEMKVKRTLSSKTSSKKGRDEERTITVAILAAIIIIAGLLVNMSLTPTPQEHFVTLYLLGPEKRAENYPELLVLGKNNTFLLWVGVENYMGWIEYPSVLVKVDNGTVHVDPSPIEPVKRFEKILLNKETWEFPMTMSLNKSGKHRLIFELWLFNEFENVFDYFSRWVSISVNVIES